MSGLISKFLKAISGEEYQIFQSSLNAVDREAAIVNAYDLFVKQNELYNIGTAGTIGFGVGAVPTALMPAGFTAMEGHYDKASPNYGNVIDASGSVMVAIPKFYFKIMAPSVNTFLISNIQYDGYVVHRMFINAGKEISYHFVDKYTCGKVNGIFTSKFGLDPCSTSVDHNPISALNNTPANNYGGLYKAVKTRGNDYFLTLIYTYMGLAMLSKAQGDAGTIATCAFKDVPPYLPKGCNNNALADTNDSSVTYAASGYSNCGKTGAITNFAKTTHNGQACGVADLNGNMYEVASGFIRYDAEGFLTLKESVDIRTIMTDNTAQGSGGAYDKNLYDAVNLIDFISATETGSWQKLGNAENQVFSFSTDRTSNDYKKTMLGIPNLSGSSSSGATAFGNDGIYRYKRNEMACLCGLSWYDGSDAGAFAMYLSIARSYSYVGVGGRASYLV
jgi:hypothetical protein